jgi:hypothetical protein
MAARRGNQSTYSGSVYDPKNKEARETDFRDFSDDDFIEAWKRACQRDRFEGLYDKLKEAKFPSVSLNCTDVRQALEFLHKATGDDVFRRAAHAMTRHGFTRGGVKLAALSQVEQTQACNLGCDAANVDLGRGGKILAAEGGKARRRAARDSWPVFLGRHH